MVDETKREARMRNRKELEKQGIKIGCNHVMSALEKARKNGQAHIGKCMCCGLLSNDCTCDDRSEWRKKRD